VNGANGIIKDILYTPNDNLPFAILIEFNEYTDPKRNWIPINPLNIFSKALNMSRTQFPLLTEQIAPSDQIKLGLLAI
jgi:hypothetical protein